MNLLILLCIMLIIALVIGYLLLYRVVRLHREEIRTIQGLHQNEIAIKCRAIQERTIQFIVSELHDNVGSLLSLLKLQLSASVYSAASPDQMEEVREFSSLVNEILLSIRNMNIGLSEYIKSPVDFQQSLQIEIDRINKTGDFIINTKMEDQRMELDPEKAFVLYRICQEILNNIIKHSHAENIEVRIEPSPTNHVLKFIHDGIGFDLKKINSSKSMGMSNIHERARMIDASLEIKSHPGKGVCVEISMKK